MRISVKVVVCAAVMLIGTAQPAHAIWRWLEHMSGPGWYDGFSIETKIWGRYPCLADELTDEEKKLEKETLDALVKRKSDELSALLRKELGRCSKRRRLIANLEEAIKRRTLAETRRLEILMGDVSMPTPLGMRVGDLREPRIHTLGWSAGLMWSTINRLRYDPAIAPEDTQVWVLTGGPFYDYRLRGLLNRVEVGGSAEGYLFFGRTTRTMVRLALEPRATVTLGTIRHEVTGNAVLNLKVRVGALWVLPGFEREDFGALPGERLGPEMLTSVRFVLDFECAPWRRNSC